MSSSVSPRTVSWGVGRENVLAFRQQKSRFWTSSVRNHLANNVRFLDPRPHVAAPDNRPFWLREGRADGVIQTAHCPFTCWIQSLNFEPPKKRFTKMHVALITRKERAQPRRLHHDSLEDVHDVRESQVMEGSLHSRAEAQGARPPLSLAPRGSIAVVL